MEKINDLEQKVRNDGSGFFFGPIIEELNRRKIDIKVIGTDPWSKPQEEVGELAGLLNLKF